MEIDHLCEECNAFYKRHPLERDLDVSEEMLHRMPGGHSMSPVECAFESRWFSGDNWCCATMELLQRLAVIEWRDDNSAGTIKAIPIPDAAGIEDQGYIVLTMYKERGKVSCAMILSVDDPPRPLFLELAQAVIRVARARGELNE